MCESGRPGCEQRQERLTHRVLRNHALRTVLLDACSERESTALPLQALLELAAQAQALEEAGPARGPSGGGALGQLSVPSSVHSGAFLNRQQSQEEIQAMNEASAVLHFCSSPADMQHQHSCHGEVGFLWHLPA